ncbi:hypothetical protein N1030_06195 [Desulfovibrio mangrovi]|uniref:hypothetical protein n=1 Tax=Desulfovibrio mangrovi TaxID=2976983 RepID=UPI002245B4F4|nr:hypothetical protein [Desulfovibrio mangrovi]UZP68559.1 hypothetical protein N1030_06195 [Desulfovibrio mangrovi]
MIFFQNVDEARERLAEIAEQLRNGEIHSAVLLHDGMPESVIVPWADFCLMVEALEAVSGSAGDEDAAAESVLSADADSKPASDSQSAPTGSGSSSHCSSGSLVSGQDDSFSSQTRERRESLRLDLDPILLD